MSVPPETDQQPVYFPTTVLDEKLMHTSPSELQVMEVFVPICIFRDDAISFNQWSDDKPDYVKRYRQVIYLFAYLIERHEHVRKLPNESQVVFEVVMSEKDKEEPVGFRIRLVCKNEVPLAYFLTDLLKDNDKRMWKLLNVGCKTTGGLLNPLHSITTEEYYKILRVFDSLYYTRFQNMILEPLDNDTNPFNPVQFFSVSLSLKHAKSQQAQTIQCLTKHYYEIADDGSFTKLLLQYPDLNLVYPVVSNSFRWNKIEDLHFPFHETDQVGDSAEEALFMALNSVPAESAERDDPFNDRLANVSAFVNHPSVSIKKRKRTNDGVHRMSDAEFTSQAYHESLRSSTASGKSTPMEQLKKEMQKRWKQFELSSVEAKRYEELAKSSDPADTEELRKWKLDRYQKQQDIKRFGLRKLRYVLGADAKGSKALNEIARYHSEYMKENKKSLCLPREKITRNLTSFHEVIIVLAIELEVICKVNTAHREIITGILACNQLYFKTKFHLHMLMSGPAQAGKTFALELIHDCAIPGSARMYAMSTIKAKTAETDVVSLMIEIHQEMTPSSLGILQGQVGRGNSAATNNTDGESLMKTQLTEGVIRIQALAIVDGKRRLVDHTVDANAIILGATNAEHHSIPDAILSRFFNVKCVNQKRLDNGGLAGADAKEANPSLEERAKRKLRRNQNLCSKIGVAVYCKVLAPIDMHVAHAMYNKFQEHGERHYLKDLEVPRHRERFQFLVQSIVTLRSIDTVWDLQPVNSLESSYGVPQEEPFKLEHLLYLEKHMFSKVEDCVLAWSFLKNQYEDPILYYVIEAIRFRILNDFQTDPESLARYKPYKHTAAHSIPQVLNADGRIEFGGEPAEELHASGSNNKTVRVLDNFAYMAVNAVHTNAIHKNDPTADEFTSLAALLHDVMEPKPQLGDIKHALQHLASKKIEGRHGPLTPCLTFQNNMLVIAISVIQTNSQDRLKKVLELILNYKGNRTGEYLYAQMLPQAPFLMDSIKITRITSKTPLKIPTAGYCENDVSELLQSNVCASERIKLPDQPCTFLDQPLDVYGHDKRVESLNLPAEEVFRVPPSCPLAYDEYISSHDRMLYPTDLVQCNAAKYTQYKNSKLQNIEPLLWRNQQGTAYKNLYISSETDSASNSDCESDNDSVSTDAILNRLMDETAL